MGKDLKGKELGLGINQRKNGSYYGRYIDQFGNRKGVYDKDLRKLKKKLAIFQVDDMRGLSVQDSAITLDDWFKHWRESYKEGYVRDSTLVSYSCFYKKHIQPKLGKKKFVEISKADCTRLLRDLKESTYRYDTLNRARRLMLDMYNRAMEDQYATFNPMKGVRLPMNKPRYERRILTLEEQRDFLEVAAGTFYYNAFVVMLNTGMRAGELFALTEDDIDFDRRTINIDKTLLYATFENDTQKTFHIGDPKTYSSTRTIPITDQCYTALKRQLKQKSVIAKRNVRQHEFSDRLFVTTFNTPLNVQVFNDAIWRLLQTMNEMLPEIEKWEAFTSHTFRHTYATRCIEAGVNPKTLQKLLGHASLSMTMDLYVHVTDDTLFEACTKFNNYCGVNVEYAE